MFLLLFVLLLVLLALLRPCWPCSWNPALFRFLLFSLLVLLQFFIAEFWQPVATEGLCTAQRARAGTRAHRETNSKTNRISKDNSNCNYNYKWSCDHKYQNKQTTQNACNYECGQR